MAFNWTKARISELELLWEGNATLETIAAHFGLSVTPIRRKACQLGFPPRQPFQPERMQASPQTDRERAVADDAAFCDAVRRAIVAGLENPHVGIRASDPQDWGIIRVTPAASYMATQSIAGDCAEFSGSMGFRRTRSTANA